MFAPSETGTLLLYDRSIPLRTGLSSSSPDSLLPLPLPQSSRSRRNCPTYLT